jgi:hypothetical protein
MYDNEESLCLPMTAGVRISARTNFSQLGSRPMILGRYGYGTAIFSQTRWIEWGLQVIRDNAPDCPFVVGTSNNVPLPSAYVPIPAEIAENVAAQSQEVGNPICTDLQDSGQDH